MANQNKAKIGLCEEIFRFGRRNGQSRGKRKKKEEKKKNNKSS